MCIIYYSYKQTTRYIEWTDSSLCIPRKIHSGAAILSADVEPIIVSLDTKEGESSIGALAEKVRKMESQNSLFRNFKAC